jgi:ADP-heptose:LPS heptosyltransferase
LTNLHYLRWCGGTVEDDYLEFWDTESELLSVYKWLEASLPGRKAIVFHPPGSRAALRRWPQGRCRNLVAEILARTPYAVVVVGGPQDGWIVEEFSGFLHPRLKVATGTFTLTQLGALIRLCGYFVGGDSGPMHIAAAVGAKTIGIFGPGSELRFGPWGCNSCVVSTRRSCTPDQKRTFEACCYLCCHATNLCMEDVSADTVLSVMATHFA